VVQQRAPAHRDPLRDTEPAHGEAQVLLKRRDAVYNAAKRRNPERWSGKARNRDPVTEVWLNPPKEHQAKKGRDL